MESCPTKVSKSQLVKVGLFGTDSHYDLSYSRQSYNTPQVKQLLENLIFIIISVS